MTGFTVYPAIDLKDGACVRLHRGDMDQVTVFSENPAAQARAWDEAGFSWLHVVDLNGAVAGHPVNADAVRAILAATTRPVQLGGGIRDLAGVGYWLAAGVRRVILGSAAIADPAFVRAACAAHPGRIVLGIDARDGFVATDGWTRLSAITAAELARNFEQAGAAAIIYTDISRDGTGQGVNIEATLALAGAVTIPVIASGGIGGADHLAELARRGAGRLDGVVVGRALYDGRLPPAEALRLAAAAVTGSP